MKTCQRALSISPHLVCLTGAKLRQDAKKNTQRLAYVVYVVLCCVMLCIVCFYLLEDGIDFLITIGFKAIVKPHCFLFSKP